MNSVEFQVYVNEGCCELVGFVMSFVRLRVQHSRHHTRFGASC